MPVTVNGGAPTAPQIAEFQTVFQVAPSSHVASGGASHAAVVAGGASGFMTGADKTKLNGIATGATANSTDATLLARANHTGTQAASTISDFNSAARAQTEAELIAGANVTITPAGSGATRTLTIAAAGGGGGGVSSVNMTVPTGLSVSGGPITSSGTLAVTLAGGYVIPTQAALDAKLDAAIATDITTTLTQPDDTDELIVLDVSAADEPKLTTVGGIRTQLSNQVVGTALGTTGTVDLNLATLTGTLQTITATGNITFTTSNRAAGRWLELRIAAGGSARTLTWPSWVAFGAALPTSLASGAVLRVAISCTGTTDASIDATTVTSV